jgi:hypothetical protein
MPLSPVSIANDLALPLIPLAMTFHDLIPVPPVPPVPPPGIYPCIEIPVMLMWPPGYALQQNKLTTTVFHKGMPLALDGHDCGYMIPHITLPPNNSLLPMHIMFSSRKFVFAASTVKANGAQIGCTWALMPMLCCAQPVTLPNGTAPLNCLNTAYVGVTWMDVLSGVFAIITTVVGDALTYGGPSGKATDYMWKLLLGDSPKNWLAKTALGIEAGIIRMVATGEGSIQIGVGSGYLGGNVSLSKGADGSWSVSATGSGGIPVPLPIPGTTGAVGGQASIQHSWNATDGHLDGTSTTTTSTTTSESAGGPVAAGGATQTSTTTTNYNPDGSVKNSSTDTTKSSAAGTPLGGTATGLKTTADNAPSSAVPSGGSSSTSGSGGAPQGSAGSSGVGGTNGAGGRGASGAPSSGGVSEGGESTTSAGGCGTGGSPTGGGSSGGPSGGNSPFGGSGLNGGGGGGGAGNWGDSL